VRDALQSAQCTLWPTLTSHFAVSKSWQHPSITQASIVQVAFRDEVSATLLSGSADGQLAVFDLSRGLDEDDAFEVSHSSVCGNDHTRRRDHTGTEARAELCTCFHKQQSRLQPSMLKQASGRLRPKLSRLPNAHRHAEPAACMRVAMTFQQVSLLRGVSYGLCSKHHLPRTAGASAASPSYRRPA